MHRETTTAHSETWQFFSSCIEIFKPLCSKGGTSYLSNLYSVAIRQIQRWSCDPDFSESAQRNPMDRYEKVLKRLVELGRKDVAMGAVDRQANIIGCHLVCTTAAPDKDNLNEELLDDLPVVARLHQAIIENKPNAVVRELLVKAKQELDEDYQAYLSAKGNSNVK